MTPLEPARLEFADDGTPFSSAFGDVYHSAHGGPAQARHVFLAGNDLPQRWQGRDRFVILETGFGLGLNFLATWHAWRQDPARSRRLHFVSFEKHPFQAADLAIAQEAWPEFAELAQQLQATWPVLTPGIHRCFLDAGQVVLTLAFGDATTCLRNIGASVDAFFLDGFSPAKNPELWSSGLCKALARLAAPGATLATWSVAGQVRQALMDAEFDLEKRPGFAGKRQMLAGRFRSRRPDRHRPPSLRRVVVVGAGVAGSTTAFALARAGWQVLVLEAGPRPAGGASSNLAGVLRPLPSADDNRLSRLTRAGYLSTRALLETLPEVRWSPCGVFHLARDEAHEAQQRKAVDQLGLPSEVLQYVDRATASTRIGYPVAQGGWYFPGGGWVQPPSLCRAALAAFPERIELRTGSAVDRLEKTTDGWLLLDADGKPLAEAPYVVLAAGVGATHFAQFSPPQVAARGQVSHLPVDHGHGLKHVVCKHGYAMPDIDGHRLIGATLQIDDPDPQVRLADHLDNLAHLQRSLPALAEGIDPGRLDGRVGFRPMSPDRLPIVGPLPDPDAVKGQPRLPALPRLPGLWCNQGFGARGIVYSVLMADLLVSRIEGLPLPLENDLVDAVDPGRFLIKACGRTLEGEGFDERT